MRNVRRRWPLMLALLLLAVAAPLSCAATGFAWLYLHRAEHREQYIAVRPYLETALPVVIACVLTIACGFGAYLWWTRKPARLPLPDDLSRNNDSLAISTTPTQLRHP